MTQEQLKTLEDFQIILTDVRLNPNDKLITEQTINLNDLRNEAIKWIKELNKIQWDYKPFESRELKERFNEILKRDKDDDIISDDYYSAEAIGLCCVLLDHFFNISEEDLK